MVNTTLQNVAKHSLLYGYVLSQPFATYVDAYPAQDNKSLIDIEQSTYGEHGESARLLQKKFNSLNVYAEKPEEYYGIITESAVNSFQKQHQFMKHGVTPDEVTTELLLEIERDRYIEKIEQLSQSIEPGMQNEDVEMVQIALAYFGYYTGNIDGIYGPLTKQALQQAEVNFDLEIDFPTIEVKEQEVEQTLVEKSNVQEPTSQPVQVEVAASNGNLVQVASSYIGTPYAWGGTSPSGFDCSGFIQFVFAQDNQTIPRTVNEIWNFSTPVDQPSVGDIVFFETYKAGPSHAGIYMGDGNFIHAGESRGVEISNLDEDYWKQRYLGAQRIK